MLFVILFFIAIAFHQRQKILKIFKQYEYLNKIDIETINMILIVSFFIILAIATINPGKTKNKYQDISEGFEQMRTPSQQDRPHPLFDIDTYW